MSPTRPGERSARRHGRAGAAASSADGRRRTLKRVLKLLERAYGPRRWRCSGKPVPVLVGTILSQNTSSANSSAGYRRLWRRFRSWNAVADATVTEIAKCIRISGLSRIKAPRIRAILRRIRQDRGRISLKFLGEMAAKEAYEYLMRFEGVGPKTALCVLLFSLGMPVFPVDTHIFRISRRLGLLPARTSPGKAHEVLEPLIAPEDRYAMHVLLITHGRRTCRARNPRCAWCDLLALCPYGRLAGRARPGAKKQARQGQTGPAR
ncbi:MAG TPA: endonuclease III [Phycisphaerae bacterium]|nr:endonuclease III [Phycisphaerae bacterium]